MRPSSPTAPKANQTPLLGVAYGAGAYLWWGFITIFFRALGDVPPLVVLACRVVGAAAILVGLLAYRGRLGELASAFRKRESRWGLALTAGLIACNWLAFIWAVTHDQILEASLGYFVIPLVSLLLGMVFFKERPARLQWVSVGLAAVGVGYLCFATGGLPVISAILSFSFGFYGLLRKRIGVGGMLGLCVETLYLCPAALLYFGFLVVTGYDVGPIAWSEGGLLALSGIVTIFPLVWFGEAANRLRLSTLGFLQYIAPTIQLLLAVTVYGEPFRSEQQLAFGLIWVALGIFALDALRSTKHNYVAASPSPASGK